MRLIDKDELIKKAIYIPTGRRSKGVPVMFHGITMASIESAPMVDLESLAADKLVPRAPYPDGDTSILACWNCGSGEYLYNEDGNRNAYCGQCGQRINWSEEEHDA